MEGGGGKKKQQVDHDHDDDDDKQQQVEEVLGIRELVEKETVLLSTKFVDHRFKLDGDDDGKLSVKQLQGPAVAHIGAAPQGSSPNSDLIYSQVVNEFTHGKEEKVSRSEFKEVLSVDILLGMAAGLKRDSIVILRIDGEDLREFMSSPSYETDIFSVFSEIESPGGTLGDHIIKTLQKLGVDQGLPPTSDSWVMSNVLEAAVESSIGEKKDEGGVSQETFLAEFKNVLKNIATRLKEKPVIVAHTENSYDGSAINNLLSNKFETDKVLNSSLQSIPRDKHGRITKDYIRVALDSLAPNAGLPPYGAIEQMDKIFNDVFKMVGADDGKKLVKEEEFKKLLLEILGSLMLQLQGNPISVSTNSVVHEPLADSDSDSSSFLQVPTSQ